MLPGSGWKPSFPNFQNYLNLSILVYLQLQYAVSSMTGRVLRTRVAVRADLRRELGELSTSDWLANQLAAIAILDTSVDLDQLLDLYLEARKVGKLINLFIKTTFSRIFCKLNFE